MSQNRSFARRVAYLCGIALLFVPISLISAPARSRTSGGGQLTKMRREYRLSQAQLGKIDPASASMSLATLGMRGVAANLLWNSAIHYKKTENWDAFMAALNQITKLQPNFVSVWQFQSWNVSYNVSVEFDDYRARYHWVKKGVDYLIEGIAYNEGEPILLSDAGWFFGHKLGRADEYRQFRRLFRDDHDFHDHLSESGVPVDEQLGPDQKPDNWLVANYWFRRSQRAVDRGAQLTRLSSYYWVGDKAVIDKKKTAIRGKNPLVFYSEAPKALIRFADAIEEDGYLDERGQFAWRKGERHWSGPSEDPIAFGDREILSSWGIPIHLNDLEHRTRAADEAEAELERLVPESERIVREQKLAKLTKAERKVLDIPFGSRTEEQRTLGYELNYRLNVTPAERALVADTDVRDEAILLAVRIEANREEARIIEKYRDVVNYEYWRQRCIAEQEDNTIAARKLLLEAESLFDDGDLQGAKEKFDAAWTRWGEVFDRYPIMVDDVEGEVVLESVGRYQKLLGQLDNPFPPEDFPLMPLLRAYKDDFDFSEITASVADTPETEHADEPLPDRAGSDSAGSDGAGLDGAGSDNSEPETKPSDANERFSSADKPTPLRFTMNSLDGDSTPLNKYAGNVLLIVNVASKCGLTPQYAELQELYASHKPRGLVVLGFPCNQFGGQEPGTAEEIHTFCSTKYNVDFPLFAKVDVNGENACELYQQLTETETEPAGKGPIRWNFEKFLIGRNGQVVARFSPQTTPDDQALLAAMEAELNKPAP